MRIIYKKSIILVTSLLVSISLNAETLTGTLSCDRVNSNDIKTVVVFLNGINNELDDAEESRALLASKLSYDFICMSGSCVVEKFYNQTDGLFDDTNELNFVGKLERDSANIAFRRLIMYMRYKYIVEKKLLQENSQINLNDYAEYNQKVLVELQKLFDNAKHSGSDAEIEFSKAGTNITQWLVDYLRDKSKIPSTYSSIFLASIVNKKDFYDRYFKYYYFKSLKTYYFSKREFYGTDNNAETAITRTVENFVTYLEEHMLSGKKIVVVAHSQGNHIIELAYSVLKEKWGADAVKAIQVVGVASVASATPSDTYITWDDDDTVLYKHDYTSVGDPLAGNFSVTDQSPANWTNDHSFVDVYMNHNLKGRYNPKGRGNLERVQAYLDNKNTEYSIDDWIIGLVDGSINAAIPFENQISTSGFINASLRWELYDDMDLWIDENGENTVSYTNKIGVFDSNLDRDDTNGEGPEHYTANISCENVHNKTWRFGIQQYSSGGSPAIAHFSIRVGGLTPIGGSYSSDNWPSDVQWIGSVKFGDISQSNRVPYTITIQ